MAYRRDWLLQQMGITQYQLRRPAALKGEVARIVPPSTRLLIVSAEPVSLRTALLKDVIAALQLREEETFSVTPAQWQQITDPPVRVVWLLGSHCPDTFSGVRLTSPPLNELIYDGAAKRALWQQICRYDIDIFTDTRRV